jgi:hypothetical protein
MQINLPGLLSGFSISPVNKESRYDSVNAKKTIDGFYISPGVYLLQTSIAKKDLVLPEYSFPYKPTSTKMFLRHEPLKEVSAGKPFTIIVNVVGLDTGRATLQVGRLGVSGYKNVQMVRNSSCEYSAEVPLDLITPGVLNYRIILQKGNEFAVFPGNHKENPFAWDNYTNDLWQTFVVNPNARLEIFNPTTDRSVQIYAGFRRGFITNYVTGTLPNQLILRLSANELSGDHTIAFVHYFGNKSAGRSSESDLFNKLMIKARTAEAQPVKTKITLIDKNAFPLSTFITLTNTFQEIEVPLNKLIADSMLLLPRPYPGFLPLWFKGAGVSSFKLSEAEKIQITIGSELNGEALKKPYSMEIETIWLEKKK